MQDSAEYKGIVNFINVLKIDKAVPGGTELSNGDLVKLASQQPEVMDFDMVDYHGTNVTRYAATGLYGSAPGAHIVNMCIGFPDKSSGEFVPEEKLVILALRIILAWHKTKVYDLQHSVINCSWRINVSLFEAIKTTSSVTQFFRSIIDFGGNVVAAAGNAIPGKLGVSPTAPSLPCAHFAWFIPRLTSTTLLKHCSQD